MNFILKRRILISMLFLGLTMLGYISYKKLAVELIPNAQLPTLVVQVGTMLEMDPDYIETQAVIPLEGAIGTLEGIEKIESNISSRSGTIMIYYSQNADLKYASLKLQERVNAVKGSIPQEFVINVIKIDLEQLTNQFMSLQVRGEGGVDRIRNIADREIKPKLENIDGIAGVQVYGGQENSIEVRLNEKACKSLGVTMNQVRTLLNNNGSEKTFVGKVVDGNNRISVNVTSDYTDVADIGNIIVKQEGPVMLRDIAEIFYGVKEESSYSRVNGMDAVTINLVNDNQKNLIELSHAAIEQVKRLNGELASLGIEIVVQNNTAETMERNIDQIVNLAITGALLAVLILWFFLRNIRLVTIIAVSIPISVYAAFNFFYGYHISINSLTLVGVALAIGMLVDNSVVVLENIYRLTGTGKDPETAVKQGTKEVWRAILASTLTTIVVFFPFIFSTNFLIKLIGKNIGVSIISTLLVSLSVALLFIPMATFFLLGKTHDKQSEIFKKLSIHDRLIQAYHLVLKASLRNPAATIIGTLIVFFTALLISLTLSIRTGEEVNTPSFRLSVTMPAGSTLEKTDAVVAELESRLSALPEKEDIISRVEEEKATITINLPKDWNKKSKRSLPEIKTEINEKAKAMTTAVITMDEISTSGGFTSFGGGSGTTNPGSNFLNLLGMGSQNESVIIKGENFQQMKNLADDIKSYLDELESINNSSVNVQDNKPEVQLHFDMDYIGRNNFTLNNLSAALSTFSSEYSAGATFRQGTESYDIIIKYATDDNAPEAVTDKTVDDLKSLEVSNSGGAVMEMQELADIIFSYGMGNIHRENQEKRVTVTYSFTDEIKKSNELLEGAREDIESIIAGLNISPGIAVEVVHEEDQLKDFYLLIGIAFILIYMILAAVFESLAIPFVLLFSIPLAALGSLTALIITGNSLLNASTLTGFLILLGIVVNNGIILIDYTNILRRRGNRRSRALMSAGVARIRPILITAITTVVAMLPLAMGKAEYVSVIGASFAITVIGGLTLSTLLTLVFIPTFYSGLENAIEWFKSLNIKTKAAQILLLVVSVFLIFNNIDKFIWRLITTILALIMIPASSWFLLNSLRKARETIISPGEDINIRIQSLVKIYDRENRWAREWRAGAMIRKRLGLEKQYKSLKDMSQMVWLIPLFGFLCWFTYFYLNNGFWIFTLSIMSWFFLSSIWESFRVLLTNMAATGGSRSYMKKITAITDVFVFWIVPLVSLVFFQFKWDNIALVLFLGLLWFAGLFIFKTGRKLSDENIDIYRLEGRFKGIRKTIYKFVAAVPLIGKRKRPFKALSCVSMEIGNGMFGLLGPNGAGKTTLMRIICGILEQSYGKVWINGLDTQEKREELQGLIGYLPQEFGSYENMTAEEYLHYQAMLKNIIDAKTREERVTYVLKSVHMEDKRHEKIGSYSGGMKQRIGIAQILLHLPRILVVDEPTAGLDPRERIRFRNLLVEFSRERVVIFSTHIIEDISSSCNQVAVLDRGKLKYLGKPSQMTREAEGHVWQFNIPASDFNDFVSKNLVVHHMSEGDNVRVRVISEYQPWKEAVPATPNLEDAYLWLLRKKDDTITTGR